MAISGTHSVERLSASPPSHPQDTGVVLGEPPAGHTFPGHAFHGPAVAHSLSKHRHSAPAPCQGCRPAHSRPLCRRRAKEDSPPLLLPAGSPSGTQGRGSPHAAFSPSFTACPGPSPFVKPKASRRIERVPGGGRLARAGHHRRDFTVSEQRASMAQARDGSHTKTLKLGKLSSTLKSPGQGEDEALAGAPSLGEGQGRRLPGGGGREVGPAAWLTDVCGSDAWCSPALLWDHEVLCLLTSADGGCHVVPTL